nr:integrase, catalytic region, zinc finger, CCHC-type, peptidase aspartic, catalytic [Tanacetum cinerariifolium]
MFDEYFNPPTIVFSPVLVAIAPRAIDLANSHVSTSIYLDAPSINLTSQRSSFNVRPINTLFESLGRWTKDHSIANVIGDPSRSVSTRKQLQTDSMWCYFDAFLTLVKLKNFKEAMIEPSWIDAMREEIHESLQSYTTEFMKKAQAEKEKYIDIIEKSLKEIMKDKVKSQLPHILPKDISDFATPVIQSTINESLENVVLTKSSSQPQSTYEVATSLTEFELKKIMLDKLEKSREDKDKDEDPLAGLDQGLKKRKTSKDVEPSRGSKSKESKSSSSKGSKSQSKSSSKSAQAREPVFETTDTEMPQDQGDNLGNIEDQPNVKESSKHDWFKKPERPPTLDRDWNAGKQIDFRPPQIWISKMAKAE